MSTDQRSAYALLIGINHYEHAPNLRGCRNDAKAWYRLCRHELQIPAEHITVLASPPFSAEELGNDAEHATLGEATYKALTDALVDLSVKLSGSSDSDKENSGLLAYSGHGVVIDEAENATEEAAGMELALCASDTKASTDAGTVYSAIDYNKLHALIGERARKNLTLVLDTCHTGPESNVAHRHFLGRRDRSTQATAAMRKLIATHPEPISSRVLMAADHDQVAKEILTPGGWRGAFSHMLCILLQRWRLSQHEGVHYFDVSHQELLYRVRLMLSTLEVKQRPQLLGSPVVGQLPVLKPGLHSTPGETSRIPNRRLPGDEFPVDTGIVFCELNQTLPDDGTMDTTLWLVAWAAEQAGSTVALTATSNNTTYYLQLPSGSGGEAWVPNPDFLIQAGSTYEWKRYTAFTGDSAWTDLQGSSRGASMIIKAGSTDRSNPNGPSATGQSGQQAFSSASLSGGSYFQYATTDGYNWYLWVNDGQVALGKEAAAGDYEFPSKDFNAPTLGISPIDASSIPEDVVWYQYASS